LASLVAALGQLKVHDASPTLGAETPMWFMYEAPRMTPLFRHAEAGAAASTWQIAEHTGTHVDAPFHFDADGATADQIPLESLLLRPYKKFDLTANDFQPGDLVGLEHLKAAAARGSFTLDPGDIAILELGWDANLPGGANGREAGWWGRNQPGLSEEACTYLAGCGVTAIASDTAAADVAAKETDMLAAHGHAQHFLPAGILIVEGLTGLANVPATGLFLALPLKLEGGTGSPLRVVLLSE
jgi:kynurenine formamidase